MDLSKQKETSKMRFIKDKHRYVYELDVSLRKELLKLQKPYPKALVV